MDNPKRIRRLSIILPSIPILAAVAIAILQNVMSVEPSADIYSGIYPVAGPLLQIVDRYTYHHTLHSAGLNSTLIVLGRPSTPEEEVYLSGPNAGF